MLLHDVEWLKWASLNTIADHEQRLLIAMETENRRGEGSALGDLGIAYSIRGETSTAIEYFKQSLTIAIEMGNHRAEGSVLGSLECAYARLGEQEKEVECLERCLTIAREIPDRREELSALKRLATIYTILGETNRAIESLELGLKLAHDSGDRREEDALVDDMELLLLTTTLRAAPTLSLDIDGAIEDPIPEYITQWLSESEGHQKQETGSIKESYQIEGRTTHATEVGSIVMHRQIWGAVRHFRQESGPKRNLNAWISNPHPQVNEAFRVTINIGCDDPTAAASVGFIEPSWAGAEFVDLVVSVSSLDCAVAPSWQELKLPRTGESKKVHFRITARVAGNRDFRIRIFLKKKMIQLQSLCFKVRIAEVGEECLEVQQ